MKDIDFDELDRAVSSVLGSGSVSSSVSKVDRSDASTKTASTVAASASESATPAKKSFVQKRTSGRFMDVVHPSSDMKSQGARASVPRQAPTVAPLVTTEDNTTRQGINSDSRQAAEETGDTAALVEQKESVVTAASDAHVLPDPLDFHNFSDDNSTDNVTEDTSVAIPEDTESPAEKEEADTTDNDAKIALEQAASELSGLNGLIEDQREVPPLDTPFVNDLAVEKRPLGAFSVGDTDTSLLSDDAKSHMAAVAKSTESKEVAESEQADSEMQSAMKHELIKDEASIDEVDADKDDAQVTADAEVVPEELHEDIVAIESREITAESPAALATTSIPQQYAQQPTEQSEEVTPVFDTTSYLPLLKSRAAHSSSRPRLFARRSILSVYPLPPLYYER